MLIHIGGIDGSGKSTVLRAVVGVLGQNKEIFDAVAWSKEFGKVPSFLEDCPKARIISVAEPTHAGMGAVIRQEIVRNGANYSPHVVAQSFALDRLILYKRLILPALEAGATVISDRSVETSIVYQPLQTSEITVEDILKLEGNRFVLKYAPNILLVVSCPPAVAMERLSVRQGKNDNAIFEKLDFLEKAHEAYHAPWFADLWKNYGTKVFYINGDQAPEAVVTETLSYF